MKWVFRGKQKLNSLIMILLPSKQNNEKEDRCVKNNNNITIFKLP